MLYIIKYIYGFLIPPGLFITALVLFNIWLSRRRGKAGRGTSYALWVLTFFVYLLSTPLAANLLLAPLEQRYAPPAEAQGDVIVILTGGAVNNVPDVDGNGNLTGYTMNRVVTAFKLHQASRLPILISGGQVYPDSGNEGQIAKRTLLSLGVTESSIMLDDQSRNTEENGRNTVEMMKRNGLSKPILVTSGFHMPRSVLTFERLGIEVVPYPTDFLVPGVFTLSIVSFIPAGDAVQKCSLATKEYLGMLALKL